MSGAQNGCHGNVGCLPTGTLNLYFKIGYFKNENVYELPTHTFNKTSE